jgi:hypothetical protein
LTKGSLISITDTLVVVMSQSSVTTDHEWRYQLENNQVALGYSISHTIVWFDTIPTGWSMGRKNRDRELGKRNISSYKFIDVFSRFPLYLKWIMPLLMLGCHALGSWPMGLIVSVMTLPPPRDSACPLQLGNNSL